MHEMHTIATDDPVTWRLSVCHQFVTRATVLTHSPDAALRYGRYCITIAATCCCCCQWPGGETETKPVVVFIKDSGRESTNLDSDDDTAANERLHGVVGDITSSFSSARHNNRQ